MAISSTLPDPLLLAPVLYMACCLAGLCTDLHSIVYSIHLADS